MKRYFEKTLPSTFDSVLRILAPLPGCDSIELWTFDSCARRQSLQHKLSAMLGLSRSKVQVHSAYKSLVFFFLERIATSQIDRSCAITIYYPVVPAALVPNPRRFLLECYPLHRLLRYAEVQFAPRAVESLEQLYYQIEYTDIAGGLRLESCFIPHALKTDHCGEQVLANAGYVRAHKAAELLLNQPLQTEQEALFETALRAVTDIPLPDEEPYFDQLILVLEAPFYDQPLAVDNEVISTAEALHEDIYFSLLEYFQQKRATSSGSRSLKPGQIVPRVVSRDTTRLLVDLLPRDSYRVAVHGIEARELSTPPMSCSLESADKWLHPQQIEAVLAAIEARGGQRHTVHSRQGRSVAGVLVPADSQRHSASSVLISAGQHANETSAMVGALRVAQTLQQQGDFHFFVSPLENPDGYALYREFCTVYPFHMHHAARYTAHGCDLELEENHEQSIRYKARDLVNAGLHINMHGYPAHEWTRPFTGYIPKYFDMWTIPKGFFLIMHYVSAQQQPAEAVLQGAIQALQGLPDLLALNQKQLETYGCYVGNLPFEVRDHIPVLPREYPDGLFPLTLITEAPDETLHGREFQLLQQAQTTAVLGAVEAYRKFFADV